MSTTSDVCSSVVWRNMPPIDNESETNLSYAYVSSKLIIKMRPSIVYITIPYNY